MHPEFLVGTTPFLLLPVLFPHPWPRDWISFLQFVNHPGHLSPNHPPDGKWVLPEINGAGLQGRAEGPVVTAEGAEKGEAAATNF